MGIQIIADSIGLDVVENALGLLTPHCEIFPLESGRFGVSIPTKVIEATGEQVVLEKLATLRHFDLWEGVWKEPR